MNKTLGVVCALALASSAPALAGAPNLAPYLHPARTIITHAYKCYARSPVAYGYSAWVRSLAYARAQALAQCAIRTPRGMTCYVTGCQ